MLPLLFSIFMGGLIGYGTNTLAVEMLFRPFTPKYIGRWRLPFTPGLIPKEQGRIAESLGALIETELFSPEVLSQALNTPETKAAISAWLDQLFAKASASQRCPRELLIQTFGEEEYIQKREDLSSLLCSFFVQKATEAKLGESFARQLSHRTDKAIPFLPEGSLEDVYVNTLGKLIDRELEKSLPEIIQQYVYREGGAFLGTPLSLTLQKHEQELPKLKDEAKARAVIRRAYELGVNHFDTADFYEDGFTNRCLADEIGREPDAVIVTNSMGRFTWRP